MALKAVLSEDDFSSLDEATAQNYEFDEKAGKYVLSVEDVDSHPNVAKLRSGHQRSKQERDDAKKRADQIKRRLGPLAERDDVDLSDMDEERIDQILPYLKGEADPPSQGEDDSKAGKAKQPDLEKLKQNARKPVEKERDQYREQADRLSQQLTQLVADNALQSAMDEVKVASPFKRYLRDAFRNKVKVVEGEDGNPVAMIDGEYGEQPVNAYLKEWSQTDEGKAFIQAPDNGGGGARGQPGGNGKLKNPFKRTTENGQKNPAYSQTEQARLVKEQPDVARRMAKDAGWRDKHVTW